MSILLWKSGNSQPKIVKTINIKCFLAMKYNDNVLCAHVLLSLWHMHCEFQLNVESHPIYAAIILDAFVGLLYLKL